MFRRVVQALALVLVGVSPGISSVAPVVIDFDSLTDSESVVGQLAGLTFSGAIAQTSGTSLNEFELPPLTLPAKSELNAAFTTAVP